MVQHLVLMFSHFYNKNVVQNVFHIEIDDLQYFLKMIMINA
jgi:hypothetical protein